MKVNAQSTGGTASVGEDFDMSIFHFVYDQDLSQNPPFGYVITEEAVDALGDSMLNDLKMCYSSIGVLMKWELSIYMYFIWNTAYANGNLSEFLHSYDTATTIYYYLLSDDGDIFNWCFEWLGMTFTLQLDENGLPWTNGKGQPNGNVKHTSKFLDLVGLSKNQQSIDGKMYSPRMSGESFNNYLPPYISGKSLYFYIYRYGVRYKLCLVDFTNTYIGIGYSDSGDRLRIYFYSPDAVDGSHYVLQNIDSYPYYSFNASNWDLYLDGQYRRAYRAELQFYQYGNSSNVPEGYCLPNNYFGNGSNPYFVTNEIVNSLGVYNKQAYMKDCHRIYLAASDYFTITNPTDIVIPEDDPISIPDIGDWVDENEPDEDPDPNDDPITVDPFDPEPEPGPDPGPDVPAIPPIVSGNDDIWPDVNVMFDLELDLDDFLGPLLQFDFPDFNTVIDSVLGPLAWISGIMSLLYEGSDFGILFTILAVFFIASAILGIYKWWNN